jgi:hypothetical protein
MFTSVIEILPVNLVQLLLASVMLFTVFCIFYLTKNRKLAPFFVFQTVVCLINILEGSYVTAEYHLISPIFTLAFGPILYLFVRDLVNAEKLSFNKISCHFLLATIALPFTQYTQVIIALGSLSQIILFNNMFQITKTLQD